MKMEPAGIFLILRPKEGWSSCGRARLVLRQTVAGRRDFGGLIAMRRCVD
jgi:hypothetical protein